MDHEMNWWSIIYAIIGIIGGVVGTKIITNYLYFKRGMYTLSKDKRVDAITELQDIIEELKTDLEGSKREIHSLKDKLDRYYVAHHKCEIVAAVQGERIKHLEEALTRAGIEFQSWQIPEPKDLIIVKKEVTTVKTEELDVKKEESP